MAVVRLIALVAVCLGLLTIYARAFSVQVFNDPQCSVANTSLAWSYSWPQLGAGGNISGLSCQLGAQAIVPIQAMPPLTVPVIQSLSYWCSAGSGAPGDSDLQLYLLNNSATACRSTRGVQLAQLSMSSFTQGACTAISILNYTAASYVQGVYATVNCSASASAAANSTPHNAASTRVMTTPLISVAGAAVAAVLSLL